MKNNDLPLSHQTETEYLLVDGVSIELKRFPGAGHKPTLVFLHEGLGCVDMWRDFPARLSYLTGCPALVYSRQGYGRSDACQLPRPLTYMHHEGLQVLPVLLQTAGIKDHVLIGHSDGRTCVLRDLVSKVYCRSENILSRS